MMMVLLLLLLEAALDVLCFGELAREKGKCEIEKAGIRRPGHVMQGNGCDESARCYEGFERSPCRFVAIQNYMKWTVAAFVKASCTLLSSLHLSTPHHPPLTSNPQEIMPRPDIDTPGW